MPEPGSSGTDTKSGASEDAKTENSSSGEQSAVPEGVVPLFFTGAGQKIFECVVDQDVTAEEPKKLIPKEKVLEDFRNRAAVSDFHPVKKKVQVGIVFYLMRTTNNFSIIAHSGVCW